MAREIQVNIAVLSEVYEFSMTFSPTDSKGGKVTYSGVWFEVGPMEGQGSYSVKNDGVNRNVKLHINITNITKSFEGNIQGNAEAIFDLVPINIEECSPS